MNSLKVNTYSNVEKAPKYHKFRHLVPVGANFVKEDGGLLTVDLNMESASGQMFNTMLTVDQIRELAVRARLFQRQARWEA